MHEMDYTVTLTAKDLAFRERARAAGIPSIVVSMYAGALQRLVEGEPPTVQPEPLEYWNAVEGWVKIDEVREHFDSVGCGTIYKTAGEDRTPLYAAPRPWVGLTDGEATEVYMAAQKQINEYWESGGSKIMFPTMIYEAIEAKLKEKNT
jgi:hypothetical protein